MTLGSSNKETWLLELLFIWMEGESSNLIEGLSKDLNRDTPFVVMQSLYLDKIGEKERPNTKVL